MAAVRTKRRRKHTVAWMHIKSEGPGVIKRARERQGYTQRELATLAKCSQAAIWKLEAGRLPTCKPEFAIRVVTRLHLSLDDVFDAHSPMPEVMTGDRTTHHKEAA